MSAALPESHRDCLGHLWPASKLDDLLADPRIHWNAMSIMAVGLRPNGDFRPSAAFDVARLRYRRPEPAALLAVLAARVWCVRAQAGGADASR